jgi:hypothetical protein
MAEGILGRIRLPQAYRRITGIRSSTTAEMLPTKYGKPEIE